MKFNHNIVPAPTFTEHTMFAESRDFAKKVIEGGKLEVIVGNNTKTTLRISLYLNGFMYGIDENVCEELKYHSPKPEWNYFTGNLIQNHFLKVSKNQGIEAIQKHVEACINRFFPVFQSELEELTVEYHKTNTLKGVLGE